MTQSKGVSRRACGRKCVCVCVCVIEGRKKGSGEGGVKGRETMKDVGHGRKHENRFFPSSSHDDI